MAFVELDGNSTLARLVLASVYVEQLAYRFLDRIGSGATGLVYRDLGLVAGRVS